MQINGSYGNYKPHFILKFSGDEGDDPYGMKKRRYQHANPHPQYIEGAKAQAARKIAHEKAAAIAENSRKTAIDNAARRSERALENEQNNTVPAKGTIFHDLFQRKADLEDALNKENSPAKAAKILNESGSNFTAQQVSDFIKSYAPSLARRGR